jgi:hypothetical protein
MADTKVSALTQLTGTPAITDELYIVDDPGGSPLSKNISVGDLLTLDAAQIYATGAAGTQTPNTSYALMTQWASNGAALGGATADQANNKITVTNDGVYLVFYSCSFTGSDGSVVNAAVFWNAVEQTQTTAEIELDTGADAAIVTGAGLVDVTTGSTDFDLRVKCDGAADVFDLLEGSMVVVRIGNT